MTPASASRRRDSRRIRADTMDNFRTHWRSRWGCERVSGLTIRALPEGQGRTAEMSRSQAN
jgi:hypothetical protein